MRSFLKTIPFKVGHSLFTRLRPENKDLQLAALKKANILTTVSNYQSPLKMFCCDRYAERCLERKCDECSLKTLSYQEFDTKHEDPKIIGSPGLCKVGMTEKKVLE